MTAIEYPTYKVLHPQYCALSCEESASVIVDRARKRQSFGVTALAVHGLVESLREPKLGAKINKIDMIVPDGQPVVWALNSLYGVGMSFKVSGPTLVPEVLKQANELRANEPKLKVYLYGSTADTLSKLKLHIETTYPNLEVCGVHEDRFRDATEEEDLEDIKKINASGANIVLVGRGCPRQEHWVADHVGKVDSSMLAVGAAFDYLAGKLDRAPHWMQKCGLEWFYRLLQEPRRLWKRYLVTNSIFMYRFARKKFLNS